MFELNGTYVIFIVMFLIFMFLLNRTVLQPVGKAIERRKARSLDDYQQARAYAAEGEAVVTRYQNRIHEVRSQAQKTVQEAVSSAQKRKDQKLKEAQADGNSKVERMRAELKEQKESLLNSLVEPELDLVQAISGKLLSEAPAVSLSQSAVQQALEEAR